MKKMMMIIIIIITIIIITMSSMNASLPFHSKDVVPELRFIPWQIYLASFLAKFEFLGCAFRDSGRARSRSWQTWAACVKPTKRVRSMVMNSMATAAPGASALMQARPWIFRSIQAISRYTWRNSAWTTRICPSPRCQSGPSTPTSRTAACAWVEQEEGKDSSS